MSAKDAKEAKEEEQAAHQALLEQLDLHAIRKEFHSPGFKAWSKRNRNIKTILSDAQRQEASMAATPLDNNSGAATPRKDTANNNGNAHNGGDASGAEGGGGGGGAAANDNDDGLSTSGTTTPALVSGEASVANGAAANNTGGSSSINNNNSASLQPNLAQANRSLSKLVLEKSLRPGGGLGLGPGPAGGAATTTTTGGAPVATYTNIEGAPSLGPKKRYCDVTGLPAPYQDPKTRLRYHDREVFAFIRGLPQGYAEQYLEARGAHTVLK